MSRNHPPCSCNGPSKECPRYGFMKGRNYEVCRGEGMDLDVRDRLLDAYMGVRPAEEQPAKTLVVSGPGTELKQLLAELRLTARSGCGCNSRAVEMNGWGVEGTREKRDEVIKWLREEQKKMGWSYLLKAAVGVLGTGLAFKLNPLDPAPGLVDEAIRRAEENQANPT